MKMRQTLWSLVLFLFLVVAMASPVSAQHQGEHGSDDEMATVRGEILDMACFVAHEAKGEDHAGCAKRCVKGGQPMGLLAEDGTVYLLYASHDDSSAYDQAKEFAGAKVTIMGKKAHQSGVVGIEVHKVTAL